MIRLFNAHPATVGETYLQHMASALTFAGKLLAATFCCLVHAVLPFLFIKTGSRIISDLHDRMVANRIRHDGASST
ncbi:MAG: DUF6356 family protein [Methyloligellaceae bacterium]